MHISLAHHKGRERQGNKEIIWNHTGWMLLLLLLMWENDLVYCIIHSSSNNFTEIFSRRLDFTKITTSSLDQQFLNPFLRFSIPQFGPFHWPISPSASSNICSPFHSAIPPFLHLPIHQTSLFFVHPSSVKSPRALITQSLLHFHLSISPQVKDWLSGRWDLLKMSLLTDWMRHCTTVLIYPSSVLQ